MSTIRVSVAQLDLSVGNITGNTTKIIKAIHEAEMAEAHVVVLPELAVTGYPPEDLLLDPAFIEANLSALESIKEATKDLKVISLVGYAAPRIPQGISGLDATERALTNAVAVIHEGELKHTVHKTLLPTYGVFDEARYFSPGEPNETVFNVGDITFGVPICEDLWGREVAERLVYLGADLLIAPNASPYHRQKGQVREEVVRGTVQRVGVPVVYGAMVGAQDELVFDGGAMIVDAEGTVIARGLSFKEDFFSADISITPRGPRGMTLTENAQPATSPLPVRGDVSIEPNAEIYLALVEGLKGYVLKNGFKDVILGLSGGIDSALVAALAADGLGGSNVWGVGLPGPYSSGGSVSDAKDLALRIGCKFDVLSIKELYEQELEILNGNAGAPGPFAGTTFDTSEENMQARLRMTLLMGISNKHGNLLLTTGNKSEAAVGYCTLYGDTSGGFAPIKDVYKTLVFDLCRWRNTLNASELDALGLKGVTEPIPVATITKPPSAELAPGQQDDQSLPPYPVLDGILKRFIEDRMSAQAIINDGFPAAVVNRITRLVSINEYKRRQVAPGTKITERSFGRDRRLPITSAWRTTGVDADTEQAVTKASIELALSPVMNIMSISTWWETPLASLDGRSPQETFLVSPDAVLEAVKEELEA